MTKWDNKDLNPTGIKLTGLQPKHVQVCLTAKALAYFTDGKGDKFACVLIGKDEHRVFRWTGEMYDEEVTDNNLKFVFVEMARQQKQSEATNW